MRTLAVGKCFKKTPHTLQNMGKRPKFLSLVRNSFAFWDFKTQRMPGPKQTYGRFATLYEGLCPLCGDASQPFCIAETTLKKGTNLLCSVVMQPFRRGAKAQGECCFATFLFIQGTHRSASCIHQQWASVLRSHLTHCPEGFQPSLKVFDPLLDPWWHQNPPKCRKRPNFGL